jgi:hypothetical protein
LHLSIKDPECRFSAQRLYQLPYTRVATFGVMKDYRELDIIGKSNLTEGIHSRLQR